MKNTWMTVVGLLAIGLLAFFYFTKERHFFWDVETKFLTDDDEPFGSELFDKMAEATLPNGYRVYDGDFEKLLDSHERCALLLIYMDLSDVKAYYEALEQFVEKGNKVMLVCGSQWNITAIGTPFQSEVSWSRYSFKLDDLEKVIKGETEPETVMMMSALEDKMLVPDGLIGSLYSMPEGAKLTSVSMDSSTPEYMREKPSIDNTNVEIYSDDEKKVEYATAVAVEDDEEEEADYAVEEYDGGNAKNIIYHALSYEIKAGKGTAYVVATPLLFTNYGVLDKNISRYLGYQMGQLADLPVVRVTERSLTEYNYAHGAFRPRNSSDSRESSPLSHLLKYPPLQWALYTMLCAALIFMLFTARHRQRVIPVMEKPVNRNMEFVRLLGTIYYRRHDNHDLFLKKYIYFKEELRRKQMIDLEDERMQEGNARMLALRTNTEEEDMAKTLELLRAVAEADELGNEQLQECIQKIDDILARL